MHEATGVFEEQCDAEAFADVVNDDDFFESVVIR